MKSTVKAYAKINLFLDITGRLENGYHTLNTVMQQINLYDIVTVETNDTNKIEIFCDNPIIPCNEKNIVYKACRLFSEMTGIDFGAKIYINKNIPVEGGMGGSSTDGAAVLTALCNIYGIDVKQAQDRSVKLGADVPFCMTGKTAVCTGIGEIIKPVSCKKDYSIGIVQPDFSCNTSEAYSGYDKNPLPPDPYFDKFVSSLNLGCIHWGGMMYNVFERLYENPRISAITQIMKENGAVNAVLTGSGSAIFGIFENTEAAENALEKISEPFKIITNPI